MGNYMSTAGGAFTPSDAFFLCEATRTGSLDIVRLFLKKNPALVYATDAGDKFTPWHVAAAAGHDVVVRVLIDTTRANSLSNNFDPVSKVINKQNAKGQTPLMLACGGGHSVCVRLLLESGALLLVADATGRSALHYAALHCRADGKGNDCVELLLAHMQQQLFAQGPVAAPPQVHANVIRKFADTGDMYGRTALHCAAWSGNTRAAHALWSVGADICASTDTDCYDAELPCNNGTTPLHFAAMRGHQPMVVLLLAAWHRMASRPGAPLPRPAFARSQPPGPGQDPLATPARPSSAGEALERQAPAEGPLAQRQGQPDQDSVQAAATPVGVQGAGEQATAIAQRQEQVDEQKQPQGELGDREVGDVDQDRGTGDTAGRGGRDGAAVAGVMEQQQQQQVFLDGATPSAGIGDQRTTEAASTSGHRSASPSEGGAAGENGSSGSSDVSRSATSVGMATAPVLGFPSPPSPRPPAMDPRLMVDAYGMTPYTIACKRKQERGSMLVELLDPSTDFCGDSTEEEGEDNDDDGDGHSCDEGGGGGAARRRQGLGRNRRGGNAYGQDTDSDDDVDSETAAAGPLLLWEGVELVRDIAAAPESFFKLQQSVSLLQLQLEEERPGAEDIGGGSGRGRSARISASGSGSSLPEGRMMNAARFSVTTEVIPDCFLCPLTCRVFRDPVVASDGVTYEREAIERHLHHVSTSPVTKLRLPSKQLYDNRALKVAVEHWSAGLLPPRASGAGATPGAGGSDSRRTTGTGLLGRR